MHLRDLSEPQRLVVLDIGDRAVGIEFADPAPDRDLWEAVRAYLLPAPVTDDEPDVVVTVRRGDIPTRFPGDAIETFRGDELRRDVAGVWQAWAESSVVRWSESGGEVVVAGESHPREAALGVGLVLHTTARRSSTVPVHAGVIAGDDGAALLLGATGQGKSTTVGAAIHAGLLIGSDDAAYIRTGEDAFFVRGLPRTPMVPAEIMAAGHGRRGTLDYRGRMPLSEQTLVTDWRPVRRLIVVGHGTAPMTTSREIARGDATRELIMAVNDNLDSAEQSRHRLDALSRLSELPRFRLELGTDVTTRRQSTAEALLELLG